MVSALVDRELEVNLNANRSEELRVAEVSKNADLQSKLANLKSELESARDMEKMRDIDRQYEHNVSEGNDKYKILRNIRNGDTMVRVEQFACM